jgi:hypothetical protein
MLQVAERPGVYLSLAVSMGALGNVSHTAPPNGIIQIT